MKGSGSEFIFRVSNDGERRTEINGLMTAFAARRIKLDNHTSPIAQRLELAQFADGGEIGDEL